MQAIENRTQIQVLVDSFYEKVRHDDLLRPIFEDVAHINWGEHLPKMYDFWENVLFGTGHYKGNPMMPHMRLSMQTPMLPEHFERWKQLFFATIDENFEGEVAADAKLRAENIAAVMLYKVSVNQALIRSNRQE